MQLNLSLQPRQSEVFLTEATEIAYGGGAGSGKALSISEKIPTPDGWKTMGELKVGDKVFDENGLPCNVVAATEVMFDRPCCKVTFSDGAEVICDEEHQWVTMTYKERIQWVRSTPEWRANRRANRPSRAKETSDPAVVAMLTERNKSMEYNYLPRPRGLPRTTKEIANSLFVRKTRINHSIDVCKPVQYTKKDLLVPPWLLGMWLGDGTTISGEITSADPENVERMKSFGYEVKEKNQDYSKYGYRVYGLQTDLKKIGVFGNKHIPRQYLESSVEDRIELLHGLMDSDGYASSDGKCVFYNTNKTLIDGFLELAKSLGINVTYTEDRAMLYGKDCGPAYNVYLNATFPLFSLPRRRDRQKLAKEQYRRRQIVSVESVESVPVRCIQVDSPRNMFLCSESFIPTHNSHLMRVLAIAYCSAIPGLQCFLFRRTLPDLLANHMVGTNAFPDMLAPLIQAKQVTINWSKNEIRFWNGSIIHLSYCQHDKDIYGYQGAQIGLLLIDEITLFTEEMYRFLRGRVRLGGTVVPEEYKGKAPKIVVSGNPGGIGHNWVKKTFIDFAPPNVVVQTEPKEGGFKRVFIPAKLSDNKVLLENDPNYADRLSGLGSEKLVSAMLDGNWDIAEGGLFDDVWRRDIHVLEPFEIPSSWRIDRSFDWGSSKPFSVGFWAESDGSEAKMADGSIRHFPKGTLFRIAEIYGWNGEADKGLRLTAKEIATLILEFQEAKPWGKRVKAGPADSAIYIRENGNCIADDMSEVGVRWVPADKRPGSRVSGWQNMRKMLKAAMQSPVEDKALFIFNNCTQFIRTFPTLPRDPKNSDDVLSSSEDHIGDEARYRCNTTTKELKIVATSGL